MSSIQTMSVILILEYWNRKIWFSGSFLQRNKCQVINTVTSQIKVPDTNTVLKNMHVFFYSYFHPRNSIYQKIHVKVSFYSSPWWIKKMRSVKISRQKNKGITKTIIFSVRTHRYSQRSFSLRLQKQSNFRFLKNKTKKSLSHQGLHRAECLLPHCIHIHCFVDHNFCLTIPTF